MICPYCRSEIIDTAKFCTECGAPLQVQPAPVMPQPDEPQSILPEAQLPETPAASTEQPESAVQESPVQPESTAPGAPSMSWYRFLITFGMYFGAFCCVLDAIRLFCGRQYGKQAQAVYSLIPGLKTADVIYALVLLGIAALCIYARFRLAQFKKNGPLVFLLIFMTAVIAAVIYLIVCSSLLSRFGVSFGDLLDFQTVVTFLFCILMFVLNRSYFRKRKALFCN